ncbi:MAG: hypothetical protein ACYDA3_06375 [Gaiellaceae bacterium]
MVIRQSFPALVVALTLLIVAACGGSPPVAPQTVAEPGYAFEAPGGWKAEGSRVVHGEDIVEVREFPLARSYTPALFDKVKPEIERVAQQLGTQLKTAPVERTVTVGGEQALQFDFAHGNVFEQLTFVLHRKTEYQLYCRRAKDGSAAACRRLVATFTLR